MLSEADYVLITGDSQYSRFALLRAYHREHRPAALAYRFVECCWWEGGTTFDQGTAVMDLTPDKKDDENICRKQEIPYDKLNYAGP